MNHKVIFVFVVIISISNIIEAQEINMKAGMGFYSLYESNLPEGREVNITIDPTPIMAVGLTWQLSDLFFLTWENSFRFKTFQTESIGFDTIANRKGINSYGAFKFFNIDSKAIGKFTIIDFAEGKILAVGGAGVSLNLRYTPSFTLADSKFILAHSNEQIISEVPGSFYNNTGLVSELGMELNYYSFSVSINFILELFKAELSGIGDNKSILSQINLMYAF